MRRGKLPRLVTAIAIAATLSVTAAACGSGSSNGDSSGSGSDKTITIGLLQGWAEDQATTELWKQVLDDKGYDVNVKKLSDAGPTFAGLAGGDIDVFLDTWLPKTHKKYVEQNKDQIEDLGVWYTDATLDITVPKYMKVDSIADLKGISGKVDGKIIGIEPGAGLTAAAKKAINGYGLDDTYTLQTSSTAAMLASLKSAVSAKKPIVVTLWHPHWAYSKYPLKDLKDPDGLMGSGEKIHAYGTKGFGDDHKKVAGWMSKFKMSDEQLASLEKMALQEHKDDPAAGVAEWIKANPDFVKKMTA